MPNQSELTQAQRALYYLIVFNMGEGGAPASFYRIMTKWAAQNNMPVPDRIIFDNDGLPLNPGDDLVDKMNDFLEAFDYEGDSDHPIWVALNKANDLLAAHENLSESASPKYRKEAVNDFGEQFPLLIAQAAEYSLETKDIVKPEGVLAEETISLLSHNPVQKSILAQLLFGQVSQEHKDMDHSPAINLLQCCDDIYDYLNIMAALQKAVAHIKKEFLANFPEATPSELELLLLHAMNDWKITPTALEYLNENRNN